MKERKNDKKMKTAVFFLQIIILTLIFTSCATIFSGPRQKINFETEPAGAEIIIKGKKKGVTPSVIKVKRAKNKEITFNKQGYQPETIPMKGSFNPTALGNLHTWYWLCILVDFSSGAAWYYKNPDIFVNLFPSDGIPYFDGLVPEKHSNKWGFIDSNSNLVIPYKYDNVTSFSEGLARINLDGKWGVIDKSGNEVIPIKYYYIGSFLDGLARVKYKKKWGFIDNSGKEIIPIKYKKVGEFSDGLARVKRDYKWCFVDKSGKEVIPIKYDEVGDFSDGLARVKLIKKWGFIDKSGKEVIPIKYEDAGDFINGIARVKERKKWGFIDNTGNLLILCKYDDAKDFSDGQAMVKLNNNWIYIDKTGKDVNQTIIADNQNNNIPEISKDNLNANAQDFITLRNGEVITAKVIEISPTEIRYKSFDNLDGPTRIIPIKEVFAINYANGTREVFNPINNPSNNNREAPAKQSKILLGGSVGFDITGTKYKRDKKSVEDPSQFTYSIAPKVGFYVSNKVSIGLEGGFSSSFFTIPKGDDNPEKIKYTNNGWQIGAFTRFNVVETERLSLLLEIGGGYGENKENLKVGKTTDEFNLWSFYRIDLLPVLSYNLSNRMSVEANFDFLRLGFRSWTLKHTDDNNDTYTHFGIGYNSNNYVFVDPENGFVRSPLIRFGIIFRF